MARPRGKSDILILSDRIEIRCKHGVFLIDLESLGVAENFKWFSKKCKSGHFYAYAHSSGQEKKVILHRLITDCPANKVVDHIDGNTLDNRKSNLRICSKGENNRNAKKNKRGTGSIYKGVTRRPSGRFGVYLQVEGKTTCFGTFDFEIDAAKKYNEVAKIVYGKFANFNKIG